MHIVIWILEDDKTFGFLLETTLSSLHSDIHIRLFEAGEDALQASGIPDIIYADTSLAGKLTGLEVVERLRRRHPDIATVFSSSQGDPPQAMLQPRDRVLPKPFSVAALLTQVRIMISEIPRLRVPPQQPSDQPRGFKQH
jgi:DNA-binding NtrC family response regulator